MKTRTTYNNNIEAWLIHTYTHKRIYVAMYKPIL